MPGTASPTFNFRSGSGEYRSGSGGTEEFQTGRGDLRNGGSEFRTGGSDFRTGGIPDYRSGGVGGGRDFRTSKSTDFRANDSQDFRKGAALGGSGEFRAGDFRTGDLHRGMDIPGSKASRTFSPLEKEATLNSLTSYKNRLNRDNPGSHDYPGAGSHDSLPAGRSVLGEKQPSSLNVSLHSKQQTHHSPSSSARENRPDDREHHAERSREREHRDRRREREKEREEEEDEAKRLKTAQKSARKKKRKNPITVNLSGTRYDVVRQVVEHMGYTVARDEDPNCYLIWNDSFVSTERISDLKPYQRINHFPGMGEICRKDALARNISKMSKLYPDEFNFVPKTWIFPSEYSVFQNYARELKKKKVPTATLR